jgi:hypothetical protein
MGSGGARPCPGRRDKRIDGDSSRNDPPNFVDFSFIPKDFFWEIEGI